jgi:hypothetical protein
MSGDDRSWNDGDKLSFSERDRRRRERALGSEGDRPQSKEGRERSASASKQYLKEIDGLFAKGTKQEISDLANAMRDAHGSEGLADACRAYAGAAGLPDDVALISLFLDADDRELALAGFDALRAAEDSGTLKRTAGLRSQLRILSESPDDSIAEAAEELLALF